MLRLKNSKKHEPLHSIAAPIRSELSTFNEGLRRFQSTSRLLDAVLHYVTRSKGKQIRPILVLLSAGMYGKINQNTYNGAHLVSLIHTATLVHDDVLDGANIRRGLFSVNRIWKNKIAVLVGDYLLASCLLRCIKNKDYLFLDIIAQVVQNMVEGELLQMQRARRLNLSREEYFTVVHQKTGSLFAACCKMGVGSVRADGVAQDEMARLGGNLGVIFQVRDDVLDYDGVLTGKGKQVDLKNKIINLPLLCALETCSEKEKREYIHLIRHKNKAPATQRKILALVHEREGILGAERVVHRLREESKDIVAQRPDSLYKESFLRLIDYLAERDQ